MYEWIVTQKTRGEAVRSVEADSLTDAKEKWENMEYVPIDHSLTWIGSPHFKRYAKIPEPPKEGE